MKKLIALLLPCLMLLGCERNKTTHHDIGEYLYMDVLGTIHVDKKCADNTFDNPKSEKERIINSRGVVFIDTADFNSDNIEDGVHHNMCSKCIDDLTYSSLVSLMEFNDKKAAEQQEQYEYEY